MRICRLAQPIIPLFPRLDPFMSLRRLIPCLLLFAFPQALLYGQCADIYDVWNGVGIFTITTSVDSACTWERSYNAYVTGDALLFTAVLGDTYTFSWDGGLEATFGVSNGTEVTGLSPLTTVITGFSEELPFQVYVQVDPTARNLKVEQGSVVTPFQVTDIGAELAKCQRYYFESRAGQNALLESLDARRCGVAVSTSTETIDALYLR